ncbi:MAG: dihydrofolate reductase [Patescibacteria group bacterium]|nr:dihydrofolate reductase [Patescibacteria group bacterium]
MKISIIAAIDEKRGIGKNGKLPWNIPEDLKRFREVTNGHPIIMGRKTWDSLPVRPLPNRYNVVITRNPEFSLERSHLAKLTGSLKEAIEKASRYCHSELISESNKMPKLIRQAQSLSGVEWQVRYDKGEVFIIGGGQVFKEALEKGLVDRLYLTIVKGDFGADTFFPDYSQFKKVTSEEKRESDGYKYTFLELER